MADNKSKQIFADNLRYYMNKNGKNGTNIIDDLNIKNSTFYNWLSAETYPRIDKIELLADYFGITKADLVEDKTKLKMIHIVITIASKSNKSIGFSNFLLLKHVIMYIKYLYKI